MLDLYGLGPGDNFQQFVFVGGATGADYVAWTKPRCSIVHFVVCGAAGGGGNGFTRATNGDGGGGGGRCLWSNHNINHIRLAASR
jgi:hypothetical protein